MEGQSRYPYEYIWYKRTRDVVVCQHNEGWKSRGREGDYNRVRPVSHKSRAKSIHDRDWKITDILQ